MQDGRPPAFLHSTLAEIKGKFHDLSWEQQSRLQEGEEDTTTHSRFSRLSGSDVLRRNRYLNIDPFSSNRIRLRVAEGQSDYINASPIILEGTKSRRVRRYIATQGPKETSVSHLWRMVWHETEQEAVIVMLTQTHEAGREKCFQYFPSNTEDEALDVSEQDGSSNDFLAHVELLESAYRERTKSTLRKFKFRVGEDSKTVWHYLFESWPDFSIPTGDDKKALIQLVKEVRDHVGDSASPPIVHCSAGVGRSGTFIALDYLIAELDEGALDNIPDNADDRIVKTVDILRQQRMMMVQGEEQFAFLYEVMKELWLERHGRSNPVVS